MESTSLELKIMYGQDLKAFNFFQKLSVYAVVSLISDDPDKKIEQKQQQKTPADKDGDGNPEWKHEMRFDLKEVVFDDCDHIFIHFELKHEGGLLGDKTIGEVVVPVKDLLEGCNGIVRFVNYEVRTTDGKPNGVLNFSCKVNNGKSSVSSGGMGVNSPSFNISGFAVSENHNPPEIHYPILDFPDPTPELHYPPPESPDTIQEAYSKPPEGLYPPPPELYPPRRASIYPPPHQPPAVYPYPGPPHPPAPHEMGHGGFHHPPQWGAPPHVNMGVYGYNYNGNGMEHGELQMSAQNGYEDWRHQYDNQNPSSWNGR